MIDRTEMKPTIWALLAANALPVFGVFFLGWDVRSALVLFWSENLVTGVFTVLRIALAQGSLPLKIFLIPFFIFHFGMFTAVHGVFVALLVAGAGPGMANPLATIGTLLATVWPGALALFASHGVSFWHYYIVGGERRSTDPQTEMGRPYGRVVILHLTILGAAFLLAAFGQLNAKPSGLAAQVPALLLIALKTLMDASSHLKIHARAGMTPTEAMGRFPKT